MIQRDIYLTQLLSFKDKEVVKVITGIRRCGKSTLLSMFGDCLRQNGVPDDRIIFINLESALYDNIRNYHELYTFISEKISSAGRYYVMIDEIQQVNGFEKAVDSLRIDHDVDIYLTGSNAYMLSSELATLLSGRYVEIKMLPLSFLQNMLLKARKI